MNDDSHRDAGNAESFHKFIKIYREFGLGLWESFNNSAWQSNPKKSFPIIFLSPSASPRLRVNHP
jgi:hypothetical protein